MLLVTLSGELPQLEHGHLGYGIAMSIVAAIARKQIYSGDESTSSGRARGHRPE
jgi:hypothetical protein